MPSNRDLNAAKVRKKNEFYTTRVLIEEEMRHYRPHFKGKSVYCNCDDPESSEFYAYFKRFFNRLGLTRVISTGLSVSEDNWMQPVGAIYDGKKEKRLNLKSGDFASPECVEFMEESDIVVTNPPFSMFRKYLQQLMNWGGGGFCVQGNVNAVKYKEVFPLFHEGKIWLGAAPIKGNWFYVPLQNVTHETKSIKKADDGSGRIMKQVRTARWFTNMDHKKKHKPYDLCETYSPVIYPVFDNFPDAINVNRREEIPLDYDGVMGVPTTFMDVFCPEQFEIVGLLTAPKCEEYRKKHDKQPFARILIRNLNPEIEASV